MLRFAWKQDEGSALVEFAVALPLLVVFIVGIYDFSGAFNQKQKIEHAAQEGAVNAAAQPMTDIDPANSNYANPQSLQPVLTVIFNSLTNSGVLLLANQGGCKAATATPSPPSGLQWTYTISGCPDDLTITINRGRVLTTGGPTSLIGTAVTVSYPYHWKFNSVIQFLVPGATYAATTDLSETSTVHNQM